MSAWERFNNNMDTQNDGLWNVSPFKYGHCCYSLNLEGTILSITLQVKNWQQSMKVTPCLHINESCLEIRLPCNLVGYKQMVVVFFYPSIVSIKDYRSWRFASNPRHQIWEQKPLIYMRSPFKCIAYFEYFVCYSSNHTIPKNYS